MSFRFPLNVEQKLRVYLEFLLKCTELQLARLYWGHRPWCLGFSELPCKSRAHLEAREFVASKTRSSMAISSGDDSFER